MSRQVATRGARQNIVDRPPPKGKAEARSLTCKRVQFPTRCLFACSFFPVVVQCRTRKGKGIVRLRWLEDSVTFKLIKCLVNDAGESERILLPILRDGPVLSTEGEQHLGSRKKGGRLTLLPGVLSTKPVKRLQRAQHVGYWVASAQKSFRHCDCVTLFAHAVISLPDFPSTFNLCLPAALLIPSNTPCQQRQPTFLTVACRPHAQ